MKRQMRIHLPANYLYEGSPEQTLVVDRSILDVDPEKLWDEHIEREKRRIEQMEQGSTSNPITAREALEAWDAGIPVHAFQVEGSPERQTKIYTVAFVIIRRGGVGGDAEKLALQDEFELSSRELDVAHSIAHVAQESGWAKMVSQHIHRDSPAILVVKPKE